MKKHKPIHILILTALILSVLTAAFRLLFAATDSHAFLSCYISFLTTDYHFLMRLAVGEAVTLLCRNREFSFDSPWFRQRKWETTLYQLIRIRRWKLQMITAKPEQFDIRQRSFEELLHNMTQAEIVHEIIMVLSFLPMCLIPRYGAAPVFIITSIAACLLDSIFVMIQRFNRPRILMLMKRFGTSSK